eukprot:gb/GFBE01069010.1/.p1 GENE.gb/GFBE01069010.1/~~gb/GFBE01069010.1/.p1  ORF type:complete len:127 (+),score=33.11 gb/GFBE01069010.1/:1-381(+)
MLASGEVAVDDVITRLEQEHMRVREELASHKSDTEAATARAVVAEAALQHARVQQQRLREALSAAEECSLSHKQEQSQNGHNLHGISCRGSADIFEACSQVDHMSQMFHMGSPNLPTRSTRAVNGA